MEGIKQIIKLRNILMRNVERSEGNVHIGMFPHVGHVGKKMVMTKWTEPLRNWFLPFGVPFVVDTRDGVGLNRKYIGYALGDDLFVHKWLFNKYLSNDMQSEILYTPFTDYSASLARKGWLKEDKEGYEQLVWRLAMKDTGPNFQKITQLNFESKANMDKDLLRREGWVVNRVLGSNAFYGMYTGPTRIPGNNRILWYNKYLVLLDLMEGAGILVDASMRFGSGPHPHINRSMRMCEGGFSTGLHQHMQRGEITEFFMLMKNFLRQYNPDSPIFPVPITRGNVDSCRGAGTKIFLKKMGFR